MWWAENFNCTYYYNLTSDNKKLVTNILDIFDMLACVMLFMKM